MKREKVLITGMGIISALGLSLKENWENIKNGKQGIGPITLFNPEKQITKIAAQVPENFPELVKKGIPRRTAKQMSRVGHLAYLCSHEAVEDSGILNETLAPERVAVIIGATGTGGTNLKDVGTTYYVIKNMLNSLSAWISLRYGFQGPNYTVTTACASAAYAIALGADMIASGQADVVITGGSDSYISPEGIDGFNALMALSENNAAGPEACRPFDNRRDGFVMGEGAGILILESEKHAAKRNAKKYAELAGYAILSEGYNIMAPEQGGAGMARCMRKALNNSSASSDEVDYVNAHGTGTKLNDQFETKAIKTVLGDRAHNVPVSSTKSMIGHTLGAAGALEAVATVLGLFHNIAPPTINYQEKDPDCDLDYVPNKLKKHTINTALCNSFGFGGHNATLVFRKCKP